MRCCCRPILQAIRTRWAESDGIFYKTDGMKTIRKNPETRDEKRARTTSLSPERLLRQVLLTIQSLSENFLTIFEDKIIKLKEERPFEQEQDHFSLTRGDKKTGNKKNTFSFICQICLFRKQKQMEGLGLCPNHQTES